MPDLQRPQDVSLSLFLSTELKKGVFYPPTGKLVLQYCTSLSTTLTKSDTSKSRSSSVRLKRQRLFSAFKELSGDAANIPVLDKDDEHKSRY